MSDQNIQNYTLLKEKGFHQLWKTPDGFKYFHKSFTKIEKGRKVFYDMFSRQKDFKEYEDALRYFYWTTNGID